MRHYTKQTITPQTPLCDSILNLSKSEIKTKYEQLTDDENYFTKHHSSDIFKSFHNLIYSKKQSSKGKFVFLMDLFLNTKKINHSNNELFYEILKIKAKLYKNKEILCFLETL